MLSGFNTNFRYRGVLFHVQTEDSGVSNPHVITHLFHGGNILASVKRDYADQVEAENLELVVKELMEFQHKEMLKQLRAGDHDAVIVERLGPDALKDKGESDTAATVPPVDFEPGPDDVTPVPDDVTVPPLPAESEERSHAFGESIVSQKPLDEVVLDYLVESARKRKRRAQ